jgi:hypothetical protein
MGQIRSFGAAEDYGISFAFSSLFSRGQVWLRLGGDEEKKSTQVLTGASLPLQKQGRTPPLNYATSEFVMVRNAD